DVRNPGTRIIASTRVHGDVSMVRSLACSLTIWIALQLGGCGISQDLGPASEADRQALVAAATAAPRLQRGEKNRVTVYGEDKLSGDYEIDPGGFVSLPLAGTVEAAGLSKAELESVLTKKFRSEYLKDPKVTVDIAAFRPIYVVGEVEKPGEYPFK